MIERNHQGLLFAKPSQFVDFFLQVGQEPPGMGAVHLSVVELEGYWQLIAKPFLTVSPPNEERVVEYSTVHAYGSIYLCINNGRCANHHAIVG